jgi:GntR family transcriptional regulator/MocR family aminotransferase
VIERLRNLRRSSGSEFAAGMQRAWAHFLALGHYGTSVARAGAVLLERRTALRDALNHYLHKFVRIGPYLRSSAYWVRGPEGMNSDLLSRAAASLGVLIEAGGDGEKRNLCTMGVTSLPRERIRAGVELLARLIRQDPALGSRRLLDEPLTPLVGRALHRALAGKTLLYNTVYGDPCTIEVRRDGTLSGTAGYAGEDCDSGRWWVEGDRWYRQWHSWAYGESLGLHTVIDGDQVRWYRTEGLLIDTAVIVRNDGRS